MMPDKLRVNAHASNWAIAEARKADFRYDCLILENPKTKAHLDRLLKKRFWPVICESLQASGYAYEPDKPKTEFHLGPSLNRVLWFMLFDECGTAFFRGILQCSTDGWMLESDYFLALAPDTDFRIINDLMGNSRFVGYSPVLTVDKRNPKHLYHITFHAGKGASWSGNYEDVDRQLRQCIAVNVKMYALACDGGITPETIGEFLTLAYEVYESC